MGGGGGGFWGEQGEMQKESNSTIDPNQSRMIGIYADHLGKYGGSSRGGLSSMLNNQRMNIQDSSQVNPWATNQFFQNSVYNPALQQLNSQTLPGIRESMGRNYWSTARRQGEQNAQQAFANQMSNQLGALQYQDEQARRQIADTTQARNIQEAAREQAQRISLLQLLDPMYQSHLAGVATAPTMQSQVYQNPYQAGFMDRLGQVAGVGSSIMGIAGGIKNLAGSGGGSSASGSASASVE